MRLPDALRGPRVLFLPAGAVMAVHLYFHFGLGWTFLAAVGFVWTLIALALIDIDRHLLPDRITLPLLWAGLAVNLLGGLFTTLESAVIGAMSGYLSLWLICHAHRLITGREGMGYGDFKMLAAIGAWLGWQVLPFVVLAGSLSYVLFGFVMMNAKRIPPDTPLPFGPSLALGGCFTLWFGMSSIQ